MVLIKSNVLMRFIISKNLNIYAYDDSNNDFEILEIEDESIYKLFRNGDC